MRKLIMAILITIATVASAFGATSGDIYLRQDVFEAKMDTFMAEIRLMNEQLRSELKQNITELSRAVSVLSTRVDGIDKRMDSLDKRIDDLRNGIYLWLVAIGLVIAWPKLFDKFKNIRKSTPAVTLEDVMRLIEENNVKLNGRTQA